MKTNISLVTPEFCVHSLLERGVCANRLWKERRESAGHPQTREPPPHRGAEGRRADHPQVTQGLFTRRQLGHHPHGHHQEHRPRAGQAQRGEIRTVSQVGGHETGSRFSSGSIHQLDSQPVPFETSNCSV